MQDWNIQPLTRSQLKPATESLAEAFAHDPLAAYMEPDERKRGAFNRWFFEKTLNYGLRYGEAWTDPDALGSAVWLPAGQTDVTAWRVIRAGFVFLPLHAGLSGMARFNKLDRELSRLRKAAVTGPFWYLMLLGVSPSAQRGGLGTRLIEAGTSRADQEQVPCYLETESLENVAYYQKRGFEVTGESEIKPGFTMWAMRREPR